METKAFSLFSTKSLNEDVSGDFIVEGIASTPTLDSDNDSLNSLGATFRSLPFPFILNHDHKNPVGQVVEATPSQKGINVKIRIPYVKEEGILKQQTDYAIHAIKYNIISGLSIGFSANKSDAVVNQKGGLDIAKYEVYELSLTPLQSNPTAFITSFKSLKQEQEEVSTDLDNVSDEVNNSNDESTETNEDITTEVISLEEEVSDITDPTKQDENTIPVDVSQVEEVQDQTSDIVEVNTKSRSVKLINTQTKYTQVKLK